MTKLMIDLYAGLGGWAEGGLSEGYDVVGFDNERHVYGEHQYPAQLVIQDVRTLHGSQFRDADLIVASPPCQEYSYMAMPWTRAKQIARALRGEDEFPEGYKGSRTITELNALFDACFRIQKEASEAARRHVPMVVENVKGAQPWVGRARWAHGSYYLWGDVPALMPITRRFKSSGMNWSDQEKRGQDFTRIAGEQATKNAGGSWFNIANNTTSGKGQNPDGRKLPSGDGSRSTDVGKEARFTSRDCGLEGIKQRGSGREWFAGEGKISRMTGSKSPARKQESAMIAKIPFELARYVAAVYKA